MTLRAPHPPQKPSLRDPSCFSCSPTSFSCGRSLGWVGGYVGRRPGRSGVIGQSSPWSQPSIPTVELFAVCDPQWPQGPSKVDQRCLPYDGEKTCREDYARARRVRMMQGYGGTGLQLQFLDCCLVRLTCATALAFRIPSLKHFTHCAITRKSDV